MSQVPMIHGKDRSAGSGWLAAWIERIRISVPGAAVVAGMAMICTPANSWGQDAPNPEASGWSLSLSPYLWLAGLDGDIGVAGLPPAEVESSFSDIFPHIDWFPPPLMLAGEVRYGRFAFITDFIYLGLEADGESPGPVPVSAEVDMKMVVWGFGGAYRALQDDTASVDLIAGGRLWSLKSDVTIAGPLAVRQGGGSQTWVDPIVGVALRTELGGGFAVRFLGDVGGFGVSSDVTWEILGTLQYELTDSMALEAGYRHLAVDFDDDGFVFDAALSGPIIGGTLRF
jgi:hypothetical protein